VPPGVQVPSVAPDAPKALATPVLDAVLGPGTYHLVPVDRRPIVVIHGDVENARSIAAFGFSPGVVERGGGRSGFYGCRVTQIAPEAPKGGVRQAECVK
jgi:hypothetical protein